MNIVLGLLASKISSQSFFSLESIKHNYKYTIPLYIEYYCHIGPGGPGIYPDIYLEIINTIQRRVYNVIVPNLAYRLHELSQRRDVISLYHFSGSCSNWLSFLVTRPREFKCNTRLAVWSHLLTVEIATCNRMFCSNTFFTRTSRLQKYLLAV